MKAMPSGTQLAARNHAGNDLAAPGLVVLTAREAYRIVGNRGLTIGAADAYPQCRTSHDSARG